MFLFALVLCLVYTMLSVYLDLPLRFSLTFIDIADPVLKRVNSKVKTTVIYVIVFTLPLRFRINTMFG